METQRILHMAIPLSTVTLFNGEKIVLDLH